MSKRAPQRIWLLQYLCPERHAICAVPYRPEEYTAVQIEDITRALLLTHGINPWCGLCGSQDLHFEHARTRYTTWDEALPRLKTEEVKQACTRALFGNRQAHAAGEAGR